MRFSSDSEPGCSRPPTLPRFPTPLDVASGPGAASRLKNNLGQTPNACVKRSGSRIGVVPSGRARPPRDRQLQSKDTRSAAPTRSRSRTGRRRRCLWGEVLNNKCNVGLTLDLSHGENHNIESMQGYEYGTLIINTYYLLLYSGHGR